MQFEYANGTPTLLETLKVLGTEGILSGEVRRVEDAEPAVQLSNLKVTNRPVLREFGLGLFLAWFYEHKYRLKYPGTGSYHLVAIDDDTTLFLCHDRRTRSVDFLEGKTYVGSEEILPRDIGTGNGICGQCPVKCALKFNYAALRVDTTPTCCDPDLFRGDAKAGCGECKRQLADWLKTQIRADDGAAVLLGGDGCWVKAPPRLYDFLLGSGAATAEELLNSFLVADLGLRHHFFGAMSGAELRNPVHTSEIDGFLYDEEGTRVMCFETSRSYEMDSAHLRKKMATAAALGKEVSGASFGYVTLSHEAEVSGGDRGNLALAELLARQVAFRIIGVLPQHAVPKESKQVFEKAPFEQLFKYYIGQLDQLVPLMT